MAEGKELNDPKEIKDAFLHFYSNLYRERETDDLEIEDYLYQTQITELTEEHRDTINRPISQEEIKEAINLTKIGKAPGPDGFSAKFYKVFKEELIQRFKLVVNRILDGETLLKT